MFKFLGWRTGVTTEHIRDVVGDHSMLYEVIHTLQMWSMPHVTLIKQWGSISIHVSSSLDYYTTDDPSTPSKGHCSLVC